MKKSFKRLISVILCLVLLLSVSSVAFAQEEFPEYPTIYVTGAKTNNIYLDGEKVFPKNVDEMQTFKDALGPCMKKLILGLMTNDYEPYVEEFYNAMAPMFEGATLDKNGEPSNGSAPEHHSSTVAVSDKKSGYSVWDFRFWYDWRLSPVTIADEMKNYIDRVIAATEKPRVQLIGRCLGANMIAAYLHYYKDHAEKYVSDVSYYSSSAMGIDYMSAIFAGELELDPQAIDNFLEYYMENGDLIEDEETATLITVTVEFFKQIKLLGIAGDYLVKMVDLFKAELIPEIVRKTLGSWPSYWAMVTPELYEKARDFIFKGCEDEYESFIKKTDMYYEDVQLNLAEDMLSLQQAGVRFNIFAKYGFPEIPVYEGATAQGDASTTLYRQSFGATSAPYGEVLSEKYISKIENISYLSPDKVVDASTCLLPKTTWFIRDYHHDDFGLLEGMSMKIMQYDLTGDNELYPRFLCVKNGQLEIADENTGAVHKQSNIAISAINFITAIFKLIIRLLNR